MSTNTESEMSPLARLGRMVVPWVGLIIVVTLTWSFIGQYRSATHPGGEATGTPDATATAGTSADGATGETGAAGESPNPAPSGAYVLVLTEGLNLRSRPMTSASVIKRLAKDTKLTLLEKTAGWYRVTDPEGSEGWVAAGGSYTKLVEP